MKRYDAVNTNGDPLYAPSPDGEMVFYSDVAQWVSVDDRLPKNTKAVLVSISSTQGPSFTEIDHYVNGEFHFQALTKCNKVTHWQPLPLPPSEGEQMKTDLEELLDIIIALSHGHNVDGVSTEMCDSADLARLVTEWAESKHQTHPAR